MLRLIHLSTQPKRYLDWFSYFCTAHGSVIRHALAWAWPKNCPLTCGELDPHLTHGSLVPVHMPKGISIDSAIPVRPPNMDGSVVFPRLCYCAPACNTCFLGPSWVHIPSSISISSVIFAQLMAECRRACSGVSFPIKIAPSHAAIWTHLLHASLGSPESTSQTAPQSVQPFLHSSRQSVPIVYNGPLLSCSTLPLTMGSAPTSNTCFLESTRVHNPNGISVGSAVFAGLTSVTDRQTDWPTDRPRYSVCNNRLHLCVQYCDAT